MAVKTWREVIVLQCTGPQMSAVLRLGNPVLQFEKSEDNFTQTKPNSNNRNPSWAFLWQLPAFLILETRDNLIYADGHICKTQHQTPHLPWGPQKNPRVSTGICQACIGTSSLRGD